LIVFVSLSKWNTYHNDKCLSDEIKISIVSPKPAEVLTVSKTYSVQTSIEYPAGSISEVAFYLNGALISTVKNAPYTIQFSSKLIGANSLIVKATNTAGKMSAARVDFTVQAGTTGTLLPSGKTYNMYPNPALNELTIELTEVTGASADLEIVSISGQRLIQKRVEEGINTISVNTLTPGIYYVLISSNGTVLTEKFVKQ
ncbi:MAG: T9SS type A sorting domain-containing protein, partial [Cytophagales bacterium]|nr:T9SS type A sorting domain-containing protein [Cytophaga sp.]